MQDWIPPYRLYVVEFRNGIVKAGITAMGGERRIQGLARKWPIRQHFITDTNVVGFTAEGELLKRLGRIATLAHGREWFSGVTFAQAKQLALQVAGRFVCANPAPRRSPNTRETIVKLSFNDQEFEILQAYSRHVGKSPSAAARDLGMSEVVRLLHEANSLAPV